MIEGLASGASMVLVPFSEQGESEQSVRARVLAERGWVKTVTPGADRRTVDPAELAAAVDEAATSAMPIPCASPKWCSGNRSTLGGVEG